MKFAFVFFAVVKDRNTPENSITINGIPFLPRLSWIVTVLSFSELKIISNEKYNRKLKLNRCELTGVDGKILFSVPVKNEKENSVNAQIDNEQNWQLKFLHAIKAAYGQSAYYIYYEDRFRKIILAGEKNLATLNRKLLEEIFDILHFQFPKISDENFSGEEIFFAKEKLAAMDKGVLFIPYRQVFGGFCENLSVMDLIFNEGPDSAGILLEMKRKQIQ